MSKLSTSYGFAADTKLLHDLRYCTMLLYYDSQGLRCFGSCRICSIHCNARDLVCGRECERDSWSTCRGSLSQTLLTVEGGPTLFLCYLAAIWSLRRRDPTFVFPMLLLGRRRTSIGVNVLLWVPIKYSRY